MIDTLLQPSVEVLSASQRCEYCDQGFLIMDTGIAEDVLDGAVSDLLPYWNASRQAKILNGLWIADQGRIQDGWTVSENVRSIALHARILEMLECLYERKPLPLQTLNFPKGTQQKTHADSIHFNSEPFGQMCGVWVALEDIGPDQGPLVYYPGSHHLPEMNFEDFGLQPDYKSYAKYEACIETLVRDRRFEPACATLRKGQAIVWAANLLHGGARQTAVGASRHSQVTHYYFEACKYWRPGFSSTSRRYFVPQGIPDRCASPALRRLVGMKHRTIEFTQRFFTA